MAPSVAIPTLDPLTVHAPEREAAERRAAKDAARAAHNEHAALAFESAWQKPHSSRHTARMWSALGLGKCSCQSSVMVRRRALALLLEHGVLGHESLSVGVL